MIDIYNRCFLFEILWQAAQDEPVAGLQKATFARRLQREAAAGMVSQTPEERARSRLISLVMGSTNNAKISGQLASWYLFNESAMVCSHEFATLLLPQATAFLNGDAVSGVLTRRRGAARVAAPQADAAAAEASAAPPPPSSQWVVVPDILDYSERGAALEHLSLYELTMLYKRASNGSIRSSLSAGVAGGSAAAAAAAAVGVAAAAAADLDPMIRVGAANIGYRNSELPEQVCV
jgi:hypothetical protein